MKERTLTGLKRAGTLQKWHDEQGDKQVRIYSAEWGAYWRENAAGYTISADQAGVYSLAEAIRVTRHCGPEKCIVYRFIDDGDNGHRSMTDKRICHAPGDQCLGCAHYRGKADVCEYAGKIEDNVEVMTDSPVVRCADCLHVFAGASDVGSDGTCAYCGGLFEVEMREPRGWFGPVRLEQEGVDR